jgi:hypothetical protein
MYSGSALVLLVVLPPDTPYFNWFYDYWGQARAFLLVGSPFTATVFKLYPSKDLNFDLFPRDEFITP